MTFPLLVRHFTTDGPGAKFISEYHWALLAVTGKWCAFLEVARERRDGGQSERITDGRTERKEHNAKSTI